MTPEQLEELYQGGAISEETYQRSKQMLGSAPAMSLDQALSVAGATVAQDLQQTTTPTTALSPTLSSTQAPDLKQTQTPTVALGQTSSSTQAPDLQQVDTSTQPLQLDNPLNGFGLRPAPDLGQTSTSNSTASILSEKNVVDENLKKQIQAPKPIQEMEQASFTKPPSKQKPLGILTTSQQQPKVEGLGLFNFVSGVDQMSQSETDKAIAAREAQRKETEILDKVAQTQIEQLSDFEQKEKERQKILDESVSKLTSLREEIGNTKILEYEPSFSQILGVIIGGLGSGLTGGPNQGLIALNNVINRDLEIQKENLNIKKSAADVESNLYGLIRQKFSDERQADNVARLMKMEQFNTMLTQAASQFKGTVAEVEANKAIGALEAEMGKVLMDYELRAVELAGKTAGKPTSVYSLGDDVSDTIMNYIPEKLRKTALDEKYAVETYIHDIGMLNDLFDQAKQINVIESFIPGTEAKAKREAIKNGMSQWFANQFVRGVASDQDLQRIEKTIADVVSLPGQIEAKKQILLGFVTPPKAPLLRTFKSISPTLNATFRMIDSPSKGAPEKRPL